LTIKSIPPGRNTGCWKKGSRRGLTAALKRLGGKVNRLVYFAKLVNEEGYLDAKAFNLENLTRKG